MLLVKASKEQLLAPLQSVSGIVERRHTLPILSNVLIERRGGSLTFLATDIEIQIRTGTDAGEGNDGAVTVGARKLLDILRALPDGSEVALLVEEKRLQIKAGRSRFNLQTLPAEDFPRMLVSTEEIARTEVAQRAFKALILQTQYAMAAQDVRYYLNGMLLLCEGGEMRAVATDGHRLAFASLALPQAGGRREMILPRKTVLELQRLLADSDEALVVEAGSNQIRFSFGRVELVSKLIDGKFPDYTRVIPATTRNKLRIARVELLQAMSRVAILSNEKFKGVRLLIDGGRLKVLAANAEQEEAQEELEVDYRGDPVDIGFNVSYLLDVLGNSAADDVEWGFNDNSSSALITIPGNEQFRYVVMPMRI
jgi:DNA polymerase-3 subunit beta